MHLRLACAGDELAVAKVHVRSWQEAYAGLLPDSLLNALDPAQRASRYTFDAEDRSTILAVEAGALCQTGSPTGAGRRQSLRPIWVQMHTLLPCGSANTTNRGLFSSDTRVPPAARPASIRSLAISGGTRTSR
jgi:hypothetical protein